LAVTSIQLSDSNRNKNSLISTTVTISNVGVGEAGPRSIRLWVDRAATASCSNSNDADKEISLTSTILPGGNLTVIFTDIHTGFSAGEKSLRVFVGE